MLPQLLFLYGSDKQEQQELLNEVALTCWSLAEECSITRNFVGAVKGERKKETIVLPWSTLLREEGRPPLLKVSGV